MICYRKGSFNCSHYAVSRINELCGTSIDFDSGDEWYPAFIRKLEKEFERIKKPENNCLVIMTQFGKHHMGVYRNYMVEHNTNDFGQGHVIKSDLGTIRSIYSKIRYYKLRNNNGKD